MDKNDPCLDSKTIRMFYFLTLKHVVSHNPVQRRRERKRVELSDEQWKSELWESMYLQLKGLLEPHGFQVYFDEKRKVREPKRQQPTYLVPFLISEVHKVKIDNVVIPRPGYTGFKVDDKTLSSIQETMVRNIRNILGAKMAIHELVFSMATSRRFVFEIYYEGYFSVKREFSHCDIECEGGVRDALRVFFDEIEEAISQTGFEVTSTPSSYRRSRNDEYLFGVYYAPSIEFGESDVRGEGCYATRGNASIDEINLYGVHFEDALVDDANALLEYILAENLPPKANLISCEIGYVDDSEEAIDIDDELIC